MKTLVLGGVRSGKSRLAEKLATESGLPVTIVVTAQAFDSEMERRIEGHRARRPHDWRVVETPVDLAAAINREAREGRCLLIDCFTLWLNNLLMAEEGGDQQILERETTALIQAWNEAAGRVIGVANETNMGVVPLGELSRRYCDEAGVLHQQLAAGADEVLLTVAGLPLRLK